MRRAHRARRTPRVAHPILGHSTFCTYKFGICIYLFVEGVVILVLLVVGGIVVIVHARVFVFIVVVDRRITILIDLILVHVFHILVDILLRILVIEGDIVAAGKTNLFDLLFVIVRLDPGMTLLLLMHRLLPAV